MKSKWKLWLSPAVYQCSTSSSGLIQAAELHGLKAVSESNNQPELSRARKEKTDSQTRTRLSDTEAREDNRWVRYTDIHMQLCRQGSQAIYWYCSNLNA